MHQQAADNALACTVGAVGLALFGCWTFVSGSGDDASPRSPLQAQVAVQSEADRQFLSRAGASTPGWSPKATIDIGERVCGAFREQRRTDHVMGILIGKGLSVQEADAIMGAAVAAYCPAEISHLNRYGLQVSP